MRLDWLVPTTQRVMVGDYISTSFLAGQQRCQPVGRRPGAVPGRPLGATWPASANHLLIRSVAQTAPLLRGAVRAQR
jgi:hypothetical protein